MMIDCRPRILKPSTQQLRIDWKHPLSRGLISYLPMQQSKLIDLVRPYTLSFNGTMAASARGISTRYNGTSQSASVAVDLSPYSAVSVVMSMAWDAYANNDNQLAEYTNDSNNKNGFSITPNSSNTGTSFEVGMSATSSQYWADYFTRPPALAWHHYVFVMDRTTPQNIAYVDGVAQTLTAILHGGSVIGTPFDNSTLYLMSRGIASLWGAGNIAFVAVYNRILSASEARWLAMEPYAFVQAPPPLRPGLAPAATGDAQEWLSRWQGEKGRSVMQNVGY